MHSRKTPTNLKHTPSWEPSVSRGQTARPATDEFSLSRRRMTEDPKPPLASSDQPGVEMEDGGEWGPSSRTWTLLPDLPVTAASLSLWGPRLHCDPPAATQGPFLEGPLSWGGQGTATQQQMHKRSCQLSFLGSISLRGLRARFQMYTTHHYF